MPVYEVTEVGRTKIPKLALSRTYETADDGSILYPTGSGKMAVVSSESVEKWVKQGYLKLLPPVVQNYE